jgi:predicted metal-dependent phosphoesterase TrpH
MTPDELIDAAKKAGLAGVCLTEHDFFWDQEKAAELGQRHNFLVIPGIEVNTEHGHILVFGLERFVYGMHRFATLAAMVEEAGGAMVAAHPYRRQLPFELRDSGDWTDALERALLNPAYDGVHAIETQNGRGSERENAFALEVCERLGLPRTAGSDGHRKADVGACATEIEGPVEGLEGLIARLREGRCHPFTTSRPS